MSDNFNLKRQLVVGQSESMGNYDTLTHTHTQIHTHTHTHTHTQIHNYLLDRNTNPKLLLKLQITKTHNFM